jgi:cell division protein FtsZ
MNITASGKMTLEEVETASSLVYREVDEEANIIWGTVIDENMGEELMVTVIATGINEDGFQQRQIESPKSLQDFRAKKEKMDQRKAQQRINLNLPLEEELDIPTFVRQRID